MTIAHKILLGVCAANSLAGFALMGWTYRHLHKLPPIEEVKKNRQN
jgi:hypothetical protein